MNVNTFRVKKKPCKLGGNLMEMILTLNFDEGEDKYDVLKRFNRNDGNNEWTSIYKGEIIELANSLHPLEDNRWTMIRPTNGGYQYMKFYPKNNPTKFSFTFQASIKGLNA
jgi:hypothetical protein